MALELLASFTDLVDVDEKLTEDPVTAEKARSLSAELLHSARYDVTAYDQWVQERSRTYEA